MALYIRTILHISPQGCTMQWEGMNLNSLNSLFSTNSMILTVLISTILFLLVPISIINNLEKGIVRNSVVNVYSSGCASDSARICVHRPLPAKTYARFINSWFVVIFHGIANNYINSITICVLEGWSLLLHSIDIDAPGLSLLQLSLFEQLNPSSWAFMILYLALLCGKNQFQL